MRRAHIAALATAIVVVWGILGPLRKDAERKRDIIVSTPTLVGLGSATSTDLRPGDRACIAPVVFTPETRQVQITALSSLGDQPLEVVTQAPGWVEHQQLVSHATADRQVVRSPITPPATVTGQLCVINRGKAKVGLIGTDEPRSRTAATMTINGRPGPEGRTFAVSLVAKDPQTLLARLDDAVRGASTLSGGLAPDFLLWILLVVAIIAIPAAPVAAFFLAARDDD